MPLFTAEVVHVDHIAQSLAQCLWVVVCSRRTQGPRDVSADQGPSRVGIRKGNSGRTRTRGSGGRASVATFTVCGREEDTWTSVKLDFSLLGDEDKTVVGATKLPPHHTAEWETWHSWCRVSADSPLSHKKSHENGRWSAAVAPGDALLHLSLLPLQRRRHWPRPRTDSWCWLAAAAAAGRSPILTIHTVAHCRRDESTQTRNIKGISMYFISAEQLLNSKWDCKTFWLNFCLFKTMPENFGEARMTCGLTFF